MAILERLSQNLNILMKRARVTTNALARQTNIPASTIKKLRNSSSINPTLSTLIPIANYFSLSIERILHDDFSASSTTSITKPDVYHLPIIAWEESIHWPHKKQTTKYKEIITEYRFSELAFVLRIENNENMPFLCPSILLIEPSIQPTNNDFVLAYINGQTPTLKQFLQEDGSTWLKSLKISSHILPIKNDSRILGVVVEYRHFLKS
jgi:SOS-response transcriptional repressor LexA